MNQILWMFSGLLLGAMVAACSPVKADTKDEILGRWESSRWRFGDDPAYVEFTSDGKAEYVSDLGLLRSTWVILPENGELKVTYSSGSSPPRCKVSVEGNTLTIENTACLNWQSLGKSITLQKK